MKHEKKRLLLQRKMSRLSVERRQTDTTGSHTVRSLSSSHTAYHPIRAKWMNTVFRRCHLPQASG